MFAHKYTATITNMVDDSILAILEQPAEQLSRTLYDAAIAHAFMESCEQGVNAKVILVELERDRQRVCNLYMVSQQDGSTVWADLWLAQPQHGRPDKIHHLRRMMIAD